VRLVAALAAASLCATAAAGSGGGKRVELHEEVVSVALAGHVHVLVALPDDYATSGVRYPVVYFLHGLPAGPAAYLGNRWLEDVLASVGPSILVAPQGARAGDTDPEYLDHGPGRNWATYVSTEVREYVDAHFRTIRSRRGRALVGISAGGYGAAMLGLNDLDHFSVIESWSGYFHPTDPTGTKAVDGGPGSDLHLLVPSLRRDERRRPTFLAFYVGRDDARFRAENETFAHELTAAHIPHVFAVYDGAHTGSLWRRHAARWLELALDHLAKPTG
jgi:enterochelin esterase-like enzyme